MYWAEIFSTDANGKPIEVDSVRGIVELIAGGLGVDVNQGAFKRIRR